MKYTLLATALLAIAAPAIGADIGISINVGEPGFFGQINIGNMPPPPMIYARPVIVDRRAEYRDEPPVYLHVPPGHEKHWDKHCREYDACGRQVYFVRDDWYQNEYVPRYRRDHGDGGHRDQRHDHGDRDRDHGDREHDHDDRDRGDHRDRDHRGDRDERDHD